MSDSSTITAPWTDEQVKALNYWQTCGYMHPFTCGSRDNHNGGGELVATPNGWVCPKCDYTQDWAHDFMFNPAPRVFPVAEETKVINLSSFLVDCFEEAHKGYMKMREQRDRALGWFDSATKERDEARAEAAQLRAQLEAVAAVEQSLTAEIERHRETERAIQQEIEAHWTQPHNNRQTQKAARMEEKKRYDYEQKGGKNDER